MPSVRILQAAVIVMGVAIAAGFAVLVAFLLRQGKDEERKGDAAPVVVRLPLPDGARVGDVVLQGDRLMLRLNLPSGEVRIVVVDVAQSAPSLTITLEP